MADKKIIEVVIKTNAKELSNDLDNAGKSASDLSNKLGGGNGGNKFLTELKGNAENLIPGFKGASTAVDGLGKQMWALVANPIGATISAVVISVKFLYEAFQNTVAGGKQLKAIFEGIDAVVTQGKDAIFAAGRALMSLDFGRAIKSLTGFGEQASKTFESVRKLTEEQQKNDKARKIFAVQQSETDKLLVRSRDILTDETATLKQKRIALEAVTKVESQSSLEKVRIAQKDLEILKEKQKAIGGQAAIKMNQEIRDAQIAVNEAETENASNGIKLNRQRKMLARQEKADNTDRLEALKEARKKEKEIYDEKIRKQGEAYYALKRMQDLIDEFDKEQREKDKKLAKEKADQAEQDQNAELNSMATYEANITAEGKKQADERKVIAKNERLEKIGHLNAYADAAMAIGNLLGQQTEEGKALAIAASLISTYAAIAKQLEAFSGVPIPGYAIAEAIATGVVGFAQVANIASVNVGGGASASYTMANTPAAPRFNVVGASTANQVAQAVGGNIPPVRAYVVANDVTSQQSLDRNRVSAATLG